MSEGSNKVSLLSTDRSISAVIVNYQKAARVAMCLESLRQQTVARYLKIAVIDNSVDAGQAEILRCSILPGEALTITKENIGYARGVNLGARDAGGGDVLLISPDIILPDPKTIAIMVGAMQEDPSIGILATLQYNEDGSRTEIARRFPRFLSQLLRRVVPAQHSELSLLDELAKSSTIDVDWVQSSFVLVRRELWDSIGGLDERYYVFMSDIDLCRRAHQQGLRVVVTSAAAVRSDGQRASAGALWTIFHNRALRIHMRDAIIYYLLNRSRVR